MLLKEIVYPAEYQAQGESSVLIAAITMLVVTLLSEASEVLRGGGTLTKVTGSLWLSQTQTPFSFGFWMVLPKGQLPAPLQLTQDDGAQGNA